MRTDVLTTVTALLLAVSLTTSSTLAGPPLTGSGQPAGESKWMKALNPTQWNWPSMPWTVEPPRIKKKTPSVMSSMNKSAKSGWTKTKRALNPTRLFENGSKTTPANSRSQGLSSEGGGFFSGLFKAEEPQEIHTVNDFLSQPHPR